MTHLQFDTNRAGSFLAAEIRHRDSRITGIANNRRSRQTAYPPHLCALALVYALTYWRQFLDWLVALHKDRFMAVILLAHAKVEKFEDPEASPYDRYSPRLHKHACALVTEWCDAVLFATRKFRTQTEDAGFGRKRTTAHAIGKDGGERILRTIGGPSCVAKNRYNLDAEVPLDWNALLTGITTCSLRPIVRSMKPRRLKRAYFPVR